ncbi:hypothetical protein ACFPRL_31220 [Pseudoclavibacter helvolus]
MYCVTRTPNRLAGTRWPTSCNAIDAARPMTAASTPTMKSKTDSTGVKRRPAEPGTCCRSALPPGRAPARAARLLPRRLARS